MYSIVRTTGLYGEEKFVISNDEDGILSYFAGYDFMGSVDWDADILGAYYMDKPEADQILSDLKSADAEACPESQESKTYLLKLHDVDGKTITSLDTGRRIAEIYEMDQLAGIYSSIEVWDIDGDPKQISLFNLVTPILNRKRWMEQEYRDYCDAVNEYGYDFEGRD